MALINYEDLARATGAKVVLTGLYCLEPDEASCRFTLHRHRAGARKVRRILRRHKAVCHG
jgi:prolyl oligopeptidase PreP (S9A serine peptidase family)